MTGEIAQLLKVLLAFEEDPSSIPGTTLNSSQQPATTAPENSTPSSGLYGQGTHVHIHICTHTLMYTYTQMQTHTIEKNQNVTGSRDIVEGF